MPYGRHVKGVKYLMLTEEGFGPKVVITYYKNKSNVNKDIRRFKEQEGPSYTLWKLEEIG